MYKENLTSAEKQILKGLNIRAMLIIQIEEALRDIKLPMDKKVLYEMSDDSLVGFLEKLSNLDNNRKNNTKDETRRR